jgi:putative Mg2+ transporter-C (MgtC) family protein
MDGMPLTIQAHDIGLRLALTVVAGLLIGYNRSEHGKAAGMRTTLLVCLAASVAMIQVNLLLPMAGRPPNSFVMNDLMRFPLGILTGVGFIGGGAILRRETLVVGVTTAATLWLVTVIGLCLGGGQLVLGMTATLIGLAALWGLKWMEIGLVRECRARLRLDTNEDGPSGDEVRQLFKENGLSVVAAQVTIAGKSRELAFEVTLTRRLSEHRMPLVVEELARRQGVLKLQWNDLP